MHGSDVVVRQMSFGKTLKEVRDNVADWLHVGWFFVGFFFLKEIVFLIVKSEEIFSETVKLIHLCIKLKKKVKEQKKTR